MADLFYYMQLIILTDCVKRFAPISSFANTDVKSIKLQFHLYLVILLTYIISKTMAN